MPSSPMIPVPKFSKRRTRVCVGNSFQIGCCNNAPRPPCVIISAISIHLSKLRLNITDSERLGSLGRVIIVIPMNSDTFPTCLVQYPLQYQSSQYPLQMAPARPSGIQPAVSSLYDQLLSDFFTGETRSASRLLASPAGCCWRRGFRKKIIVGPVVSIRDDAYEAMLFSTPPAVPWMDQLRTSQQFLTPGEAGSEENINAHSAART